jgi:hypothetical protein
MVQTPRKPLTLEAFLALPVQETAFEDAPCPVPADLVIEIISPDQSFGDMAEKASDLFRLYRCRRFTSLGI